MGPSGDDPEIDTPASWAEIDLYRLRHRRRDWTGVPMFPCTDEFGLAEVRFRVAGRQFKSVLSSISGHVFDFATTPGPRDIAFRQWDARPDVVSSHQAEDSTTWHTMTTLRRHLMGGSKPLCDGNQ